MAPGQDCHQEWHCQTHGALGWGTTWGTAPSSHLSGAPPPSLTA